eukprot:CAMPEP_0202864836 /NCGR_PEP_ID=MMETSP1391-20130828/4914_1 /ASSEMBLY_ACC=CAM_ASM_000867 /TAXON_ID=1034604 /ORGANISM="Chlamydomonas leiostraca, Strain SAG 11-49" /LENGTH=180 /DNA_ID=CAMNT_0049544607 /DNA_START=253 /DNA_END=795 /DNA_ORIENTATION=+
MMHRGCAPVASTADSSSSASVATSTSDKPAASSPQELTGADKQAWDTAVEQLASALSLPSEDAQALIEKGFGWKSQAFWRGTKVKEVPGQGVVAAVLQFLTSKLGLQGPDLLKVVKTFPEVLACSVSGQLEVAVGKLQNDWKLNGDVLMRAVVRQPQVLGYSLDCEGSCIGECNRCWARF